MQMFNGFTMGVLNHYRVNLDIDKNKGSSDNGNEVSGNYDTKLNDITTKIKEITDVLTNDEVGDDAKAKEAGKKLIDDLNASFNESVKNYFKNNTDKLKSFKATIEASILSLKNKNGGNLPSEYVPLQNLLDRVNSEFSDVLRDNNQEFPELNLNKGVKLEGIQAVEIKDGDPEDKKGEQNFFKGRNETVGIYEKAEGQDKSELDKTRETIGEQLNSLGTIDVSKLPENVKGEIEQLKILLKDINNAINNTTPDNVKFLQSFISKNLEGTTDGESFDRASKRSDGTFDGKFGPGTLGGLNKVLERTGDYITSVKNLDKNENNTNVSENLDTLKAKDNVTIQKGGEIKPEDLIDGPLPEGFTVSLTEGQEIKIDEIGETIVKVDIKQGDDVKKTIDVKVKIVEKLETKPEQISFDTTPLELGNDKYQVVQNSENIAQNAKLKGATFYSSDKFEGEQPAEGQSWDVAEIPVDRDYKCFMKIEGNPNIYEVVVDKNGNISPIARNFDSKISVLIKNNESCKRYLESKLPEGLDPKPIIGWNTKDQDYVVQSYGFQRTVEPMTINGKWVVDRNDPNHLSKSLALLNFTNFLRGSSEIHDVNFKNDNPDLKLDGGDLYVRVNKKSNRTYDENGDVKKMGKWYKIPKERFGLDNIDDEVLKKFIKYNNHEDWENKGNRWDKKKSNRYFKKI